MSQSNIIELKTSSILQVPLYTYDEFTFIDNQEEFKTSRIISDLLSPRICRIHLCDPTFNTISINTQNYGHFSNILNLVNFKQQEIPSNEIPFIIEMIEFLESENINFSLINEDEELTIDNIIKLIKEHEKHSKFYFKQLAKEIEFASSNFYSILAMNNSEIFTLEISTIELILSNANLHIENEDQLVTFVNQLYKNDKKLSFLYEYVFFNLLSEEKIDEFISIFNYNDLTEESWKMICKRLSQKTIIMKENNKNNKDNEFDNDFFEKRYDSKFYQKLLNKKFNEKEGIELPYSENHEFEGIFHYLQTHENGNINEYVNITSTELENNNHQPNIVIDFQDKDKYFSSGELKNAWICFDFKDKQVMLSHYTIRSYNKGDCQPKSWVIEGCNNDSKNDDCWEVIDSQINSDKLKTRGTTYTFHVNNSNYNKYRYIRMRNTDANWDDTEYLCINAIELFGCLINKIN